LANPFPNNTILPDGNNIQRYNPLLLFKDFYGKGTLLTDNTLMTNADTFFLASKDLIQNPINPFTGSVMEQKKDNGVTIATTIPMPGKYVFDIDKDDWLHVKDNIFEVSNWQLVENP
jgi:hypothetical protein